MPTISIVAISDPVCPWCFIGALRLSQAISLYLKTVCSRDIIITKWHAYQLDANTPTQPLVSKMASKWGIDEVPAVKTRLNSIAKKEGLEFNFNSTIGNTRDAHRLEKLGRKVGLEMGVAMEIMRTILSTRQSGRGLIEMRRGNGCRVTMGVKRLMLRLPECRDWVSKECRGTL